MHLPQRLDTPYSLSGLSSNDPCDEIEYQTQDDTEEQAGDDGKRKAEVISSNGDVPRKLAEPSQEIPDSWNAVCDQQQEADHYYAEPDSDEDPSKISPLSHQP